MASLTKLPQLAYATESTFRKEVFVWIPHLSLTQSLEAQTRTCCSMRSNTQIARMSEFRSTSMLPSPSPHRSTIPDVPTSRWHWRTLLLPASLMRTAVANPSLLKAVATLICTASVSLNMFTSTTVSRHITTHKDAREHSRSFSKTHRPGPLKGPGFSHFHKNTPVGVLFYYIVIIIICLHFCQYFLWYSKL